MKQENEPIIAFSKTPQSDYSETVGDENVPLPEGAKEALNLAASIYIKTFENALDAKFPESRAR